MTIFVLYDGHCGLCRHSIKTLQNLDWLHNLEPVDFQNETEHLRVAPEIPYAELDRAMHIKFGDGRTLSGFASFRALAWHLPLLWVLAPFLYVPGVKIIGDAIYAKIAARRKTCTHESCGIQ